MTTPVYRLNNGAGKVSAPLPSLAGAYRLAEKIHDLPYGTFVERGFQGVWKRIGPRPVALRSTLGLSQRLPKRTADHV